MAKPAQENLPAVARHLDKQSTEASLAAAVEGLQSSHRNVCEEAAKSLGRLGLRASPHAGLLGACALGNAALTVRVAATVALGALGEAGVPELIHALDADCPDVHEAAKQQLEDAGEVALPRLSLALMHTSCTVRLAAAGLIGRQRILANVRAAKACKVAASELLNPMPEVQGSAADALALLGTCASTYVDELMSEAYVLQLVSLLRGGDVQVQCKAAAALGSVGSASGPFLDEACEIMAAAMSDVDPTVRLSGAKAIGCLGQSAGTLIDGAQMLASSLLRHGDWETKINAAEALGELGRCNAKDVSAVAALLEEDVAEAQCAAVVAIGCLGTAATAHHGKACATASAQLKSSLPAVRVAAAAALGSLGMMEGRFAEEAVRVAAVELRSKDVILRLDAARALGRLGYPAAACLTAANETAEVELLNPDASVRIAAAAAIGSLLGGLGSDENKACEVAVAELNNKDWNARADAAGALFLLGPAAEPHAGRLAEALRDNKAEVRDIAGRALAALGKEGLAHLAVAMRDVDWKARNAAAKALNSLGYADAFDHVTIKAMRDM